MQTQSTSPVAMRHAKKDSISFMIAMRPLTCDRKTHLLFVMYANRTARIHAIIVLAITGMPKAWAQSQ